MSGSRAPVGGLLRSCRLAGVALLLTGSGSGLALAGGKSPVPAAPAASATQARSLDLSAPPVSHVLTPQQIQTLTTEQESDNEPTEDVTVKQSSYEPPVPVGTFRALPWALLHPLEAWKIIEPIPDD